MNRMQTRNIMSPCFFHLFQYLTVWCEGSSFIHSKDNVITFTPMKLMNSRILENLGMTTWEAYRIRGAMTQFLMDSNKNALCSTLNTVDTRDILKNTLRSILARRKIHMISTDLVSDICLYVCPVCEEIKNTLTTFTSLRSITYDYVSSNIYCTKKRDIRCAQEQLFSVPMNQTTVLLNDILYIICKKCKKLAISGASQRSGQESCFHICDICRITDARPMSHT